MFKKILDTVSSIFSIFFIVLVMVYGYQFVKKSNMPKKIGIKCDNKTAMKLAEKILNSNYWYIKKYIKDGNISSFKIDPENIFEWDYKNNRYLCRAKIKADILGKKKSLIYDLNRFGIFDFKENKKDRSVSGWFYYQTFTSTTNLKRLKKHKPYSLYVEIIPISQIPKW